MQPAAQPPFGAGLEDSPRLVCVERAALAEDVDPLRVRGGGVEHRARHQVDVRRRVGVGGHHVGAQEGGVLGELTGDGQAARLVLRGEAVAALDLQARRTLPLHLLHQLRDVAGQLLVGGGTGGGDGGADAAGGVGLASHPGLELGRPVAAEDEVGVAVDEAGNDRAAGHVDHRVRGGRLGGAADPGHVARPAARSRRRE